MFGIMALSYRLVPWFLGEEFNKSKILLILGAPLIMAIGLNNVSGIQYLIPSRKQNIFTKSVVIGAIFNFSLNMILIPVFKSNGAIVASVLAELLILLVQLYYIKGEISVKIVYQNSKKYIISGIIMYFITFLVGLYMKPIVFTTIVQIVVGIFVYAILLIIFKDKLFYETLNKIKIKFFEEIINEKYKSND